MKTKEWATPNRMQFDSPLKTFNRQVSSISTGNVWGGTQHSGYIRAFTETECNGFTRPEGHLQNYDLEQFRQRVPYYVIEQVREHLKNRKGILYHFFYYNGEHRVTIGAVLTTGYDDGYKLIQSWYLGTTTKQWQALDECINYITEES